MSFKIVKFWPMKSKTGEKIGSGSQGPTLATSKCMM